MFVPQQVIGELQTLQHARTLDPVTRYHRILDYVTRVLPADHACLLLSDGMWCRIAASTGSSLPVRSPVIDLLGPCRAALTAAQGSAIRLGDMAHEPLWCDIPLWIGEYRLRGALIVPLVEHGTLIGSLHLGSFTPHCFTAEQARAAGALSACLSGALGAATRYQQVDVYADGAALPAPLATSGIVMHLDDEALMEDLALLKQVETGRLATVIQPHAVAPLVDRTVERVQRQHAGRHVERRGARDLRVMADAEYATWILAALIDNALRYSPSGSRVDVAWTLEAGLAVVRVRDQGSGIDGADRAGLFTRLGRVPAATAAGVGLGLYLGRRLAEAQRGTLDLEATGPTGSSFALRLLLAPD
ncbi:MAG TPA: ATP-binding protein [Chloroflexota bacterium]|nr:ATP-binding protein [Chloroflexota bacterium]